MAGRRSAGLLVYRRVDGSVELLLVHPGGPYWQRKDAGAWSIPKGEYDDGDDPLATALREFGEELGQDPPGGEPVALGEVKQPGGKVVTAWAVEGDAEVGAVTSNLFEMEWPPKSGRMQQFPEVDRAGWFGPDEARAKLLKGQLPFVDRLLTRLDV
jgi:predicted NUDIX family NTP pyrophosphohydrolase